VFAPRSVAVIFVINSCDYRPEGGVTGAVSLIPKGFMPFV